MADSRGATRIIKSSGISLISPHQNHTSECHTLRSNLDANIGIAASLSISRDGSIEGASVRNENGISGLQNPIAAV